MSAYNIQKVKNQADTLIKLNLHLIILFGNQFVDFWGFRLFCYLALFVLPGLVKEKTGKERLFPIAIGQNIWNSKAWWKRRLQLVIVIKLKPVCMYWKFQCFCRKPQAGLEDASTHLFY